MDPKGMCGRKERNHGMPLSEKEEEMDETMIIFYEVPKSSFVTNMPPKMGKPTSILLKGEKTMKI